MGTEIYVCKLFHRQRLIQKKRTALHEIALKPSALSADGKPQAGMGISAADTIRRQSRSSRRHLGITFPYRNIGGANFEEPR